jgi:hypothetical protein
MKIYLGTNEISRAYLGANNIGKIVIGSSAPPSTPADIYIAAVLANGGSLSGAEQTAIQTFYNDLDTAGVYSKMHVMYPILGGVANANKINFINPGTNDLTFTGTWAHSATGSFCASNNSNFANTGFNPSASASPSTNFSVGAMAQNGASNTYIGIGTSAANYILMGNFGPTEFYYPGGPLNGAGNGFTGGGAFLMLNRTLSNSWKGGVIVSGSATGNWSFTSTQSSTYPTVYNGNWYFNGINGLGGFNSGGLLKFGYLATSMNDTELQNLADAVNTLNTAFSRNLWV